jgi:nucleotide-binding universal stress UspA family protein
MIPYRTLLVGVDFTPCSVAALQEASRLARSNQGRVLAVHVVDTQIALEMQAAMNQLQDEIRRGLIADAQRQWRDLSARVPEAKNIELHVSVEHRVLGLIRRAREVSADLIVLGAFGSQHPDVGAGTVATACVRNAANDVLLVRDTHGGPFQKIVSAIDFSDTSRRALDQAAHIARADGATLHVVHVFAPLWDRYHYREATPQADPQFLARYQSLLKQKVADFCQPTRDQHPELKMVCEVSDAGRHRSGIVAYADRVGADLICLGSRGQSNLRDFILGSTAEKALANSKCSVLAVKPAP